MTDSDADATSRIGRRRYLLAGASALAAASAGCMGGGGGGGGDGGDGTPDRPTVSVESGRKGQVDDWLSDASNYDGSVFDYTDEAPTIDVGAQGNGGNYAYEPAAVAVSTGTTVTWEWTGKGQQHNVLADDGAYESQLTAEQGFTFTQTFDSPGVSLYVCSPHKGLGMKGAVVVQG